MDFSDGSSTTGSCVYHKYAAEGDYTVWHKVQTTNGRTAEVTKSVSVRTHDVAITSISAPKAASAGQTRQISVYLKNNRYPEDVEVYLYKSVPSGQQQLDYRLHSVPVRAGNRTTRVDFSYTFTAEDATIGKVTFKAVAYLL